MKVKINFSNRFLYTFIAIVGIILISVVVYAYSGNVGHTSDQIDEVDPSIPTTCSDNQIISWNSTDWDCADASSGLPTDCTDNQILKWNSTDWDCADDLSDTSFTYTSTSGCDAGDEPIGSRYEERQCCGFREPGCSGSVCCTVPQGEWDANPTPGECGYNDIYKNNYGNCWIYNSATCTANVETFLCRASL
ncbi:hypothetical protein BMS3Abin17_00300 [archaeon BMS3Abin17]|nr:hypothetical protein BMS3Abin17_00300 [archaeon BMS3Abin17]HDZ60379.1 hypothetical protein [Candidatus Pacearchaeota archaeon]